MEERYELLLQCYLSEQMTAKQLYEHFNEDSQFEMWFKEKMSERTDSTAT